MKLLSKYSSPNKLIYFSRIILPWSNFIAVLLFAVGIYLGLFIAPPDYQQGDTVRIMYIHVPSATMASLVYALMAISSACYLIWKYPMANIMAKASAPIGAIFTLIALCTGALWGQPTWGTWWVWDARLTSVLLMLFLYLGYIGVWHGLDNTKKASKIASILAVVGAINLPIIKFSVDWWSTLHQGASILRLDGPSIHPEMLLPLFIMWGGFVFFFISTLILRIENEIYEQKITNIRIALIHQQEKTG